MSTQNDNSEWKDAVKHFFSRCNTTHLKLFQELMHERWTWDTGSAEDKALVDLFLNELYGRRNSYGHDSKHPDYSVRAIRRSWVRLEQVLDGTAPVIPLRDSAATMLTMEIADAFVEAGKPMENRWREDMSDEEYHAACEPLRELGDKIFPYVSQTFDVEAIIALVHMVSKIKNISFTYFMKSKSFPAFALKYRNEIRMSI